MTSPSEHDAAAMSPRRAQLVGVGLIGGSVGKALRAAGWHVTGRDLDQRRADEAVALGAIDAIGEDPDAELCVLAVPVSHIVEAARWALGGSNGVVTDVGSVKAGIVAALDDPRFVGGHPMAGSEQDGVAGSDAAMFQGATWVLTPGPSTSPQAFQVVCDAVTAVGADVVAMDPAEHDRVVAMVSHVPHLTAATLMRLATARASQHASVLRLAAGGFRDMTRIASGHPAIWPDICSENRDAICEALDELIGELGSVRQAVAESDRAGLLGALSSARAARQNLPTTAPPPDRLAELRVTVPDRPGVLAEITAIASGAGVNIYDIEIAHSAEGPRGVVILVVAAASAAGLRAQLEAVGYRVSGHALS